MCLKYYYINVVIICRTCLLLVKCRNCGSLTPSKPLDRFSTATARRQGSNGRPGNPKVARLWRWQWPKSLIFLLPSKSKRIEPTQCHLNSRNLPSPHRPTGEGDQVLFEKTTSWACKTVLLAHERLCSSRCRAQGGIHSTPPVRDFYRSLLLLHQRPHSTKRTIQFVLPKIVARADLQLGSMSVSVDRNMFMSFACDHIEYRNHHSCS